jgi:CheY-like chemotaxis protein
MADYTKRILIIEDNKLDVRLLKDILEWRGYETLQTGFGTWLDRHRHNFVVNLYPLSSRNRGVSCSVRFARGGLHRLCGRCDRCCRAGDPSQRLQPPPRVRAWTSTNEPTDRTDPVKSRRSLIGTRSR